MSRTPMEPFSPFRLKPLYFKGGGSGQIKETEDQKALAKIAADRFKRYQEIYKPVENQYMQEVQKFNEPVRQTQASNKAVADTQSVFGKAIADEVNQRTAQSGANINSGAVQSAINTGATKEAIASADNVNRSQQATQDAYVGGLQSIVGMGNGQASEAIQGMGDIAAASNQKAMNAAVSSHNDRSATRSAIGAGIGAATETYKRTQEEG